MKNSNKEKKLLIVAPAYNEELDLPVWLNSLKTAVWRKRIKLIIVVDDGSKDQTAKIARSFNKLLPVKVISYKPNGGPGFAFRRGLRAALEQAGNADYIVTMELDNTSDLKILPKMIAEIDSGSDVCVASYYTTGGGFADVPWWRMLISEVGNLVIRWGCGIGEVKTFSSFYRVYRPEALKQLYRKTNGKLFIENGFACMVELLARLVRQGAKVSEVPMILVGSRRKGTSKMRILPTVLGYFRVVLQYRQ